MCRCALQALHGLALHIEDFGDVQQYLRLEVALLGLMRLEQEHGRRAKRLAWCVVASCLCEHPRLQSHPGCRRMVRVIRIGQRVGEHDGRLHPPVAAHDRVGEVLGLGQRVIAGIGELDCRAENLRLPGSPPRAGPP